MYSGASEEMQGVKEFPWISEVEAQEKRLVPFLHQAGQDPMELRLRRLDHHRQILVSASVWVWLALVMSGSGSAWRLGLMCWEASVQLSLSLKHEAALMAAGVAMGSWTF